MILEGEESITLQAHDPEKDCPEGSGQILVLMDDDMWAIVNINSNGQAYYEHDNDRAYSSEWVAWFALSTE